MKPRAQTRLALAASLIVASLIGPLAYGQRRTPEKSSLTGLRGARPVRELGKLQSADSVEIRCLVPGRVTILSLVPDGTRVKKGDLLIAFESAKIKDKLQQAKIELEGAAGQVRRTDAAVKQAKSRAKTFAAIANLEVDLGKLAREGLVGGAGELTNAKKDLEGKARVYEARLVAAELRLRKLGDDAPPELNVAVVEAKEGLLQTKRALQQLEQVVRPRKLTELKLEETRRGLERQLKQAELNAQTATAEGELARANQAFALMTETLKRLQQDLSRTRVLAPRDGTVVYHRLPDTSPPSRIEVGSTVRERQIVMYLPDLSRLEVSTLVRKANVGSLRVGQAVSVQFEAEPHQRIAGVVKSIGKRPEFDRWYQRNEDRYRVIVQLKAVPKFARIGMSGIVTFAATDEKEPAAGASAKSSATPGDSAKSPPRPKPRKGDILNVDDVLTATMKHHDKDGDGFITLVEMKKLSGDEKKQLLQIDTNKDQKVSRLELKTHLKRLVDRLNQQITR